MVASLAPGELANVHRGARRDAGRSSRLVSLAQGLSWELPPGYQDEGAVWCAIVQLLLQPIHLSVVVVILPCQFHRMMLVVIGVGTAGEGRP